MPNKIPVAVAKEVAKTTGCRQIILLAWDGELTHIVTYGKSVEDCEQAAFGGNMLKRKWGWPECNDHPSRVKALKAEIVAARAEMVQMAQRMRGLEDQLKRTI